MNGITIPIHTLVLAQAEKWLGWFSDPSWLALEDPEPHTTPLPCRLGGCGMAGGTGSSGGTDIHTEPRRLSTAQEINSPGTGFTQRCG